jgi:hypothetical protein
LNGLKHLNLAGCISDLYVEVTGTPRNRNIIVTTQDQTDQGSHENQQAGNLGYISPTTALDDAGAGGQISNAFTCLAMNLPVDLVGELIAAEQTPSVMEAEVASIR